MPAAQRFATSDGLRLAYYEWGGGEGAGGSAPPVILHHGFSGSFYAPSYFSQVQESFASAGIAVLRVNSRGHDLAYNSLKEWDSVAHMALVVELETEFDVMFDTDDILGMSTVARAREILTGLGVSFDAA